MRHGPEIPCHPPEGRSVLPDTVMMFAAEIVVVAVAVAIYLGGVFVASRGLWRWIALGGLLAAGAALWGSPVGRVADSPLDVDNLANFMRWLALGSGLLLVGANWRPLPGPSTPEYLGSLLLAIAGAMLAASARDLVLLFVSLELISIPTYILLYLGRRDAASQEAAAKYFYLSIFASALLLYGFSFLYGATGSMDLGVIHDRLKSLCETAGAFGALAKIGLALILAGLGFRIAAVPFHFYAADVYQGTTHENAAMLSVLPKIAGLTALVRVVAVGMAGMESYAWPAVLVLSVLTMTLGNAVALWQDNVRRLLAYSSIAHAGYMLIGLAVFMAPGTGGGGDWDGVGAMLFYLLVYAVATIGAFAALAVFGSQERQLDSVEELAGLAWTPGPIRPAMAWLIALFLLSLTGIPTLAGFWGKLAIFASSLSVGRTETADARPWFIALAVIGVVNSAIAAAYYLRVVGVMFFRTPSNAPPIRDRSSGPVVAALACAVLTVVLIGLYPGPWIGWANESSPRVAVREQPPRSAETTRQSSDGRIQSIKAFVRDSSPLGAVRIEEAGGEMTIQFCVNRPALTPCPSPERRGEPSASVSVSLTTDP
jgi:NADH-quinone oxidoreductase subunit N